MDYAFPRYLLAKQTVDDRALNKDVLAALRTALSAYPLPPSEPLSVIEVGAGIGTMLARLLRWGVLTRADYTLVDEMRENTNHAQTWLPAWAAQNNIQTESLPVGTIRLFASPSDPASVTARITCADVFDYIDSHPPRADLLIAHAFLDLLPMPASLPRLFSLLKPGGLAWLTINFDGVTTFEPAIDPALDARIEQLYHASMDSRPTGGDSQSGRHLFSHIAQSGARILAAGASDWVVHPVRSQYPAEEAYFLHFILHFFEQSLSVHPHLDPAALAAWLAARRAQVEHGQLVYIAHQVDFLVQV